MKRIKILATAFFVLSISACAVTSKQKISWDRKSATPGAQITYEEVERKTVEGKTAVKYKMRTTGLPKDKTYNLWSKWADNLIAQMPDTFNIDDSGYVYLAEGKGGFSLLVGRMLKGEPMEYALISTDQSVKAFGRIVPFPCEVKGEGGCRLSMEMMSRHDFGFIIEGFEPGEEITTVSKSDGETLQDKYTFPNEGKLLVVIDPRVVGKRGGSASFTATGKKCSVTINYDWGSAMKFQ